MPATRFRFRRDKNAVVAFNPATGTKLRFAAGPYTKARIPELVDIKITDYCPFACGFCYQNSTVEGQHATLDNMRYLAEQFGHNNVLEVALGGGEPTDHPHFIKILETFKRNGVVPNFTTKSMGWVKRNWHLIENTVGAFAYSAEKPSDVESAALMFADIPKDRINLHYVMGLDDETGYVAFMRAAHKHGFRVTLLGYKTTGRGATAPHQEYGWWPDVTTLLIEAGVCPTMSIDTPLAEQFDGIMPVDKRAYHTREGYVSAYVDAVAMTMGASSFDPAAHLVPFNQDWVETYKTI